MARQFFRAAVKRRLIGSNPFGDMKGISVQANQSRYYFISRDVAAKVLDACSDAEWRLIFALSRFGGLQCPSEHLALRWSDVDWERGRITVRSSKTEHQESQGSRVIPIFPELRPHLEALFFTPDDDEAKPDDWVIKRYRDRNSNRRTQFERIITRAGVKPWPKLFQNLRSTRQTELAEQFPHSRRMPVDRHSQAVARKHYLQVTHEHSESAAQCDAAGDGR